MNVKQWIDIFSAAGIDQPTQHRWHREFERAAPDEHRAFLAWLGLPPHEIERIREASRA
jgi:hypothetical protein